MAPFNRRHGHKPRFVSYSLRWLAAMALLVTLGSFGLQKNPAEADNRQAPDSGQTVITCKAPFIIDGDTFTCARQRIRLTSIDAPEMPDHCRKGRRCTPGDPFASRDYLRAISRGMVNCLIIETDSYGRIIARCQSGGQDLSCAMVDAGTCGRALPPAVMPVRTPNARI